MIRVQVTDRLIFEANELVARHANPMQNSMKNGYSVFKDENLASWCDW
jgi:hypothetical protein